jgi:predicted CXXCH cytochrome family protein
MRPTPFSVAQPPSRRSLIRASVIVALILSAVLCKADEAADPRVSTHQAITVTENSVFLRAGDGLEAVPDISTYCLTCHAEETSTTDTTSPSSALQSSHHVLGSAKRSHPVDIPYPRQDPGYVEVESLDHRILLIRGMTTCLSCHSYDSAEHQLVLPVRDGKLCQACHLL